MKLEGPTRYRLNFDANRFTVVCPKGSPRFSGLATSRFPKLYVASVDEWPVYVGTTRQSVRNRLRLGWNATGESGYHGYAWRHHLTEAFLDIWCHTDPPAARTMLDIETVEAEVVLLIRLAGQWPAFQTEIHFHASTDIHRNAAKQIMAMFRPPGS